jgi:hypothetical protein
MFVRGADGMFRRPWLPATGAQLKPRSGAGRWGDREHAMHVENANQRVKQHLAEPAIGGPTDGRDVTESSC